MKKSTASSTRIDTFVDTSGFYCLLVQRDEAHLRASRILAEASRKKRRFVTTDYVLDETATLLRSRGHGNLAKPFFETVLGSAACQIEWMDAARFAETERFFVKHNDKEWSFTDCFSFWLMSSLGLREALTTDHHFQQAGFVPLLA